MTQKFIDMSNVRMFVEILKPSINSFGECIPVIWQFFNAPFFTSLVCALAVGLIVQRSAARGQNKQMLKTEINATNSAIALCWIILKNYIELNRTYAEPQKNNYDEQKKNYLEGKKSDGIDYKRYTEPSLEDIRCLRTTIFEKISSSGSTLEFTTSLANTADSVNICMRENNAAFKEYQEKYPSGVPLEVLYGVLGQDGRIDTKHGDRIYAIHKDVNGCIDGARDLIELLIEHGNKLRKDYGKKGPKIIVPNIAALKLPAERNTEYLKEVKYLWEPTF